VLHELEFMYYLSFQEATAGGDEWRERQRRFWNEHLGRWLPDLARAVREADLDPYYNTLADLVLVFLRLEESLLAEEFAQPN
jgi:TorA maturation chaperone TorD